MSTATGRRRPPQQAKNLRNEDGPPPPSSSDDAPPRTRRSKRLGNVEIEDIRDFEALRTRKRRRRSEDRGEGDIQASDEGDQDEGEDAATSTSTITAVPTAPSATDRPDQRQTRTNIRVDILRKAAHAHTRQHTTSRSSKVAKAPRAPDHTSRENRPARLAEIAREARPPRFVMLDDSVHAAETEPVGDVYEFRASSPRKPRAQKVPPTGPRNRRVYTPQDFETGNGLFVEQEADAGDEGDGDEDDGAEDDVAEDDGAEDDGNGNDGAEDDVAEDDGVEDDGAEDDENENNGDENGGDEQLYDDPTIVGLPPSAQTEGRAIENTVHGAEPQSSAATERLRRLVVDMGPAPPEPSDEADESYPDDHLIFNKPTGKDRVAAAPIKSHSLKSITELMSGNGWKNSLKSTFTANQERLSKRTRPLWNELCELKVFWEGMPRAPLFDQQCDYLHSDKEDAINARQCIKNVDRLVSAVAEKAMKPSSGEESDMPPPRFVVDLYERIVPLLVDILEIVFRKGSDLGRSWYTGSFTKTMLHIMQRVAAWIERLYEAMQASLARRRLMEQSLSKRSSRGKLGEYLRGFKSELEQTWEKADEIIEQQRRYDEKLLLLRARREQEQRELEEVKRRQRELCDRRLNEHLRRGAVQSAQVEASLSQRPPQLMPSSQPQPSQRTSRGTQRAAPARTEPGDRAETAGVGPSKPWPEDDAKRLLRILTTRPWMEMEALVWEFERSEEDVRAMVGLLKRSARTYAASKGKAVPAFAAG
ncbi:hypothetical protein LZ30DRAFT_821234 [Colletotrichum cereale]|nr:hypothetical protein LZ30DRAFT_821234 [Colletotrichum cereale]